MKVTEKGQVTVPQQIRYALGIEAHSEVEWVLEGDHAILRRSVCPDMVAERFAEYKGRADSGLTTDQIMAMTRT